MRPPYHHHEHHFGASLTVRDVVLGAADGLTVPFALAAGLAGAISSTNIIVTAGLAEIVAGAIAMGLGGYLAARSESDHYASEYRREAREIVEIPHEERREVAKVLAEYGLEGESLGRAVDAIAANPKRWVDFMMRFELGLERPAAARALTSAGTIGAAYLAGGLVPLIPYMLLPAVDRALWVSVAVTLVTLLVLGTIKGKMTGMPPVRSGVQTVVVGAAAAAVAYLVARWVA
ncbi:MAG: VIT1/CCC1 transporter family protein [Gemmatimonas sp.]